MPADEKPDRDFSRREFVGATALAGTLAVTLTPAEAQTESANQPSTLHYTLIVNEQPHEMSLDSRVTLLDVLRERLHLTGSKKGCDHGQCGACTVLVNGRRVNSCLTLAASVEGDKITTIEGLSSGDTLHPVQAAFVEHDGFQCGYCTPGQICSSVALLQEVKAGDASAVTADVRKSGLVDLTDDEIRERMSGNICRCGAYPGIVAAVRAVYGSRA